MSDHLVTCDLSGFVCKRSECKKMWNGLIVRADLWEPRHPQDFIKVKPDDTSVRDVRPEQAGEPNAFPPITAADVI